MSQNNNGNGTNAAYETLEFLAVQTNDAKVKELVDKNQTTTQFGNITLGINVVGETGTLNNPMVSVESGQQLKIAAHILDVAQTMLEQVHSCIAQKDKSRNIFRRITVKMVGNRNLEDLPSSKANEVVLTEADCLSSDKLYLVYTMAKAMLPAMQFSEDAIKQTYPITPHTLSNDVFAIAMVRSLVKDDDDWARFKQSLFKKRTTTAKLGTDVFILNQKAVVQSISNRSHQKVKEIMQKFLYFSPSQSREFANNNFYFPVEN